MSNIDKQALRERYSPQPSPKCHICGAVMEVQKVSGSNVIYGCTGEFYSGRYAKGRSIADAHYEQSRVIVVDCRDQDVLALLDDLEAAEKRIAEHDRKCDEQYLLGMRAGWNFGLLEDADGFDAAYASRSKPIEAERAGTPKGE